MFSAIWALSRLRLFINGNVDSVFRSLKKENTDECTEGGILTRCLLFLIVKRKGLRTKQRRKERKDHVRDIKGTGNKKKLPRVQTGAD